MGDSLVPSATAARARRKRNAAIAKRYLAGGGTLSELAAASGLSRTRLNQIVHAETGGVDGYAINHRLVLARKAERRSSAIKRAAAALAAEPGATRSRVLERARVHHDDVSAVTRALHLDQQVVERPVGALDATNQSDDRAHRPGRRPTWERAAIVAHLADFLAAHPQGRMKDYQTWSKNSSTALPSPETVGLRLGGARGHWRAALRVVQAEKDRPRQAPG